ncbi:hypothetical protein LVY72_05935 [Arthrobacter sp. I2-34]|uniref:Uncharacterized protein n=1 Tax=Arthrobacter hankyongi TaxID=2904801 RepID=A0ABS9L4A7_9MICC|nr:hypothetical protein [Arthrobacter hankyongi]MCG2621455.1 hypothetical protein [Arthrobacter hankyongi]
MAIEDLDTLVLTPPRYRRDTPGKFSLAFDADGNPVNEFGLNGPGKVTDVCAALS